MFFNLTLRLLIVRTSPSLLLLCAQATKAKASPTSQPREPTSPLLHPRVPRCDFPGEIYNRCLRTSLRFKYDVSSSSSSSSSSTNEETPPIFKYATLEPGQASPSVTCDADFLEVDGFTLLVDDTALGPLKDRPVEARSVYDRGEYKLDAYTLTCFEAFHERGGLPEGAEERKDPRDQEGYALHAEGQGQEEGMRFSNGATVVRCHVRYNGNQP